ncbi:SipW-dependent-type signal peptide-containing protein [Thermococcus sp.]|uniref:SipW-dependent-type signal peptide-containing protein n=1 Tax=Thermococcus sp. TaxID=35749 RepID=UPI0026161A51|nr:SipW-dependent-type signal peptide-containing protein [Thermococcus sp.]
MKNLLLVSIFVGLLLAGVGYGTWAFYQDTEAAQGNSITLGTLDLVLTNNVPNADGQWIITNGYPGQPGLTSGDGEIHIYNVGDVDAEGVTLWFTFDCHEDDNGNPSDGDNPGPESDTNQTGVGEWLKEIQVTEIRYSDNNGGPNIYIVNNYGSTWDTDYIHDVDGDDMITLYDLSQQEITGLYPPSRNGDPSAQRGYTAFEMSFRIIDTGSPQNYWQGDYCIMTVHVKLRQKEP